MELLKLEKIKAVINILKKKYKQTTFCYCPKCGNELISSGSFISDEETVTFICVKCGVASEWDFDAPSPILVNTSYK